MRTLLSAVVLALVAAVCLGTFTEDAHAQFFGVRYSEKVSTTLKTAIGSTQPPPFGIKVASGDGSKFANVGTYFILTLDAANSTNATAIEEILARYISGDSLLVLARGTNVALNRPQQAWVLNSYLGIRVSYVVIAQIQDTLIKRMAMLDSVAHLADSTRALLPSQSGKSGKVLSTNGTNLFWTSAAGAVSSIIATTPLTGGTITSTGAIGIAIADATHTGALSNTDWSTLMAKQDALPSLIASRVLSNNGSALFWSTAGAGTVTSVSGTGGTTGLTVTNVPITTTGTFTLGGTLVVANGGTGAGTRAQGLLNLLPDISGHIGKYLRILPLDSSIVWDTASGGGGGTGTVTSLDVSGGITGLTTSGGPVTTSGTITLAGTLSDTNGGTQQSSWTKGDLLYASAANALSKLTIGSTNKVLTVISGLPSWQTPTTGTVTSTALAMPAEFSVSGSPTTTAGTFTVTKVSQAQNLVYAAPDTGAGLPYFRVLVAADIPALSAADITSGTLAVARGGTNIGSYSTGDLLYASSSSVLSKLAVGGAHGVVHGGSVPSYSAVDLASDITGTLQVANGGTNSSTALSGSSIMISNGTSVVQGAAGTSTTLLHGNAGGAPTYSAVATADITDSNVTAVKIATSAVSLTKQVSGLLPVANGGTGQTSYTDGQLLIGNSSGSTLAKATLTGTANEVVVTNGGGTITLATPQDIAAASSPTFAGLNLGSGALNTVGDVTMDNSATRTISIAASSSAAGKALTVAAGAGNGTDMAAGGVTISTGASTGSGSGTITIAVAPSGGSSGTASRSATTAALFTQSSTETKLQMGLTNGGHAGALAFSSGGNGGDLLTIHSATTSGTHNDTLPTVYGSFVMSAGAQTIDGAKTFTTAIAATSGGTGLATYTTGDMLYASATNTLSKKAIGSTNDILTVATGIPSWTSTPTISALNVTNGTTLLGAFNLHVQTTKTTTYTILSSDCVVPCDATSAAFTATLPAGATVGQVMILSKIDAGVNAVTIAPGAGQTIIAATGVLSGGNVSLTTTDPTAHLCYIGSNNWILISRD